MMNPHMASDINEFHIQEKGSGRATACLFNLVHQNLMLVEDTTRGRDLVSVTNMAALVVDVVKHRCGKRLPKLIIYRDTDGRWDRMLHDDEKFTGFAPIQAGVDTQGMTHAEAANLANSTIN